MLAWGVAAAAPGILWDGGGTDRLAAIVDTGGARAGVADAISEGFGFAGLGGLGAVLTGAGHTHYEVRADAKSQRASLAVIHGFGEGTVGGTGVLSDAGGDDIYEGAALTVVYDVVAAPSAGDEVLNDSYSAAVGMGSGNAGTGLLEDLAGDDLYSLRSRHGRKPHGRMHRSPVRVSAS